MRHIGRGGLFDSAAVLLLGAAVALAAAGCGSSDASATGNMSTTSTTLSVQAPLKVGLGTGSVGGADPTTTVPLDGGRPIPSEFTAGQNIIITTTGVLPSDLEASVTAPVVWTNLSGRPQRIVFVGFPVDSGTIPPGGTFTWTVPNALVFEYKSTSGVIGRLAMNPAQA